MTRWGLLALVTAFGAGCAGDDDGPSMPRIDAAPAADADPVCAMANSMGGFPDCSVCDAVPTGCDTIDKNGQEYKVCDCSAPCPCGLHCGDVEIAPGVVVGNVCIR